MEIKFETFAKVLTNNFKFKLEEIDFSSKNKLIILSHSLFDKEDLFVRLELVGNIVSIKTSESDFFLNSKEICRYDLTYCKGELEIVDIFVNILIQQDKHYLIFN